MKIRGDRTMELNNNLQIRSLKCNKLPKKKLYTIIRLLLLILSVNNAMIE